MTTEIFHISMEVFFSLSFDSKQHRQKCNQLFLRMLKDTSKGSPIESQGRRGVEGFYARHFSENRHCDGGAYLISVAVLPLPLPKEGSYSFATPICVHITFPEAVLNNECGLPIGYAELEPRDCRVGVRKRTNTATRTIRPRQHTICK